MLAPVQITSATRQNLWRLTFIRTLVSVSYTHLTLPTIYSV